MHVYALAHTRVHVDAHVSHTHSPVFSWTFHLAIFVHLRTEPGLCHSICAGSGLEQYVVASLPLGSAHSRLVLAAPAIREMSA